MSKANPLICPPLSTTTSASFTSSEIYCSDGLIAAGTVLGPYAVKRLANQAKLPGQLKFVVNDFNGKEHVFGCLDWEAYLQLKQISSASSADTSNCSVLAANGEKQLFAVVTKPVQTAAQLKAIFITDLENIQNSKECSETTVFIKKFGCPKCPVSFSNPDILKRHQSFYCKEMNTTFSTSSDAVRSVLSPLEQSARESDNSLSMPISSTRPTLEVGQQNTILLPVAFHTHSDDQLVQLIGAPQTIIPVAIHRKLSPLLFNQALLLDSRHMKQLSLPQSMCLPVGGCSNADFHLPLAFVKRIEGGNSERDSTANTSLVVGQSNPLKFEIGQCTRAEHTRLLMKEKSLSSTTAPISIPKRKKTESIEDVSPLDLSLNKQSRLSESKLSTHQVNENRTTKHDSSEPTIQKRSLCDCGVSFISAETLSGHKQFYCRNRPQSECSETDEKAQKNAVNKSGSAEKETREVLQQQQSMRLNRRSILQCFVCIICSYKGYSPRGIKNHLRTSHANEIQRHINLLDFIHPVNIVNTS